MARKIYTGKESSPLNTDHVPEAVHNDVKEERAHMLSNGLSEALNLSNPLSMGAQLSQVDTLFKNNRWYMISNMRQLLSEIYVEHGLVQTIVDVPVDDGLRGGVEIKSKQLDEDQIQDLQACIEQEDDINKVGQALKWNRLFGGAAVLIITDQDAETPFDMMAVKEDSRLEFRAIDMWELYYTKQNTADYATALDGSDKLKNDEFYNYYGQKVHHTRVMLMKGLVAPSFVRPRLRGWGFSVVEALVRSINQYLKANDLGFEVLDEFKLDIFKIKNLTNTLLKPSGTEAVQKRIQLSNMQKNYQNAITMDSEDDYVQKQLSFSGLAETMAGIRMQIAADMRMPLTKVFGISAAGFNSGEDDIEVYNAMVESQVRTKAKRDLIRVVSIRCQQMFGMVPDDLQISFKPLRVMSAEQEENVKTQKFNRLLSAKTANEITSKEFRDACNRDNLLSIQLEADVDLSSLAEPESDTEEAKPAASPAPKSTLTAKEAPKAKG